MPSETLIHSDKVRRFIRENLNSIVWFDGAIFIGDAQPERWRITPTWGPPAILAFGSSEGVSIEVQRRYDGDVFYTEVEYCNAILTIDEINQIITEAVEDSRHE